MSDGWGGGVAGSCRDRLLRLGVVAGRVVSYVIASVVAIVAVFAVVFGVTAVAAGVPIAAVAIVAGVCSLCRVVAVISVVSASVTFAAEWAVFETDGDVRMEQR